MLLLKSTFLLSLLALGQFLIDQDQLDRTVGQGIAQQVLAPNTNITHNTVGPRPFYMIAHRVLTEQGVTVALSHGANAIEIDMTAWRKGWWAAHDGTITGAGDNARTMFEAIARERNAGKTVTFVWLDIKNPDLCDPGDPKWRHCSIDGLRDLAREILEPAGVRVLYGFYKDGNAFKSISSGLNSNEAVNLNGEVKEVQQGFAHGPADKSKRVMSYGFFHLPFQIGNCREEGYYTCTELRQGVESGTFGKVFGWVGSESPAGYVNKLLDEAGIDGLICGFKVVYYHENLATRKASKDILRWLDDHKDRRYLASQHDNPW